MFTGISATLLYSNILALAKYLTHLDTYNHGENPFFGGYLFNCFIALKVVAWAAQFAGHGVFEKRAPALTTNLLFMLLAPFFGAFEMMNLSSGYKQAQKDQLDKVVLADIAYYRKMNNYKPMFEEVKVREE